MLVGASRSAAREHLGEKARARLLAMVFDGLAAARALARQTDRRGYPSKATGVTGPVTRGIRPQPLNSMKESS